VPLGQEPLARESDRHARGGQQAAFEDRPQERSGVLGDQRDPGEPGRQQRRQRPAGHGGPDLVPREVLRLGHGVTAQLLIAPHALVVRADAGHRAEEFLVPSGAHARPVARLGEDGAVRIRTFRLIVVVAQELRTLMDQLLRADGLTTQQAALITVVDLLGTPSLSQAATALGTTHQNARQLADALQRKGFLQISTDQADARVRRLSTTAKSESYWRDRSAVDQQRVLHWLGDLTPAEAQTLFELLAKVEHRARSALSRPPA
jgi:DNA-binding MarR family transcriptional regulator